MTTSPQKSAPLTKNQSLVLGSLNHAQTPLSAYSILDDLRDQGLRAPLQVYRALEKLIASGLVHRLESTNSFVACQHSGRDDHKTAVFTICNSCEQVEELSDTGLTRHVRDIAASNSFELERSVIELQGRCDHCSSDPDL